MLQKTNQTSYDYPDLKQFIGYMEKKFQTIDVVKFLAEGSFGKVYHIKCKGQNFALKVQKGKIGDSEKKLYDLMKKNKYQNLVNTTDYLEGLQFSYIMMEYCSRDLYHDIRNKQIEQINIMYIVRQIVKGVEELHQNNIIHRDLKPENILIFEIKDNNRTQLQYKIADFGTNFQMKNENEDLAKTLVGTPYYIAPEVGQDKKKYDLKADIWSLGVIIFELLLGEPPFNGKCIEDFQIQTRDQNLINQKLQYLYSKKEFFNYKLIDLVQQTLNQDPKERPSIFDIVKIIQPVISKSVERKTPFINQTLQTQEGFKQKSITIHQNVGSISQNQQNQFNNQNGIKILNQNQIFVQYFNQPQNSSTNQINKIQLNNQIASKSPLGHNQLNNKIPQTNQMKIIPQQQLKQPPLNNSSKQVPQKQNQKIPSNPQIPQNQQGLKNNQIQHDGSSIGTYQSNIEKTQNDSQISNQSLIQDTKHNLNPLNNLNKNKNIMKKK